MTQPNTSSSTDHPSKVTADITIGTFLDALASHQSTPGGGSAAALCGSHAAALLSMVINFTVGKKKYADVEAEMRATLEKSEELRRQLTALADRDIEAFNAVSACYGMPKETPDEKTARTNAMQEALKDATRVPFQVAEASLEVLKLTEPVAAKGNRNVVSDAATALYLADAALRSAIINVNINFKFIKDPDFVTDWTTKRDSLLQDASVAYDRGKMACEQTLDLEL